MKRTIGLVILALMMTAPAFSMTREQAMELLMEKNVPGKDAVDIAWTLSDMLDHQENHLYTVAILRVVQLIPFYMASRMPLAQVVTEARAIVAYENYIRYLPGH